MEYIAELFDTRKDMNGVNVSDVSEAASITTDSGLPL